MNKKQIENEFKRQFDLVAKDKLKKSQDATDRELKEMFADNTKRAELKRQERQIREAFMNIGSYLFIFGILFGILIMSAGLIMICLQLLYWILSILGIPVFVFVTGLMMLSYGLIIYLIGDE